MPDSKKGPDNQNNRQFTTELTCCPRCYAEFTCNAANIEQCQCWGVNLQPEDWRYVSEAGFRADESRCLCRKCLLEIQDAAKNSSSL